MTKSELLRTAKPILFNADMDRAILDNRKTATRRCVKPQLDACPSCMYMNVDYIYDENAQNIYCARCGEPFNPTIKSPYQSGDILYVREGGIIQSMKNFDKRVKIYFPADDSLVEFKVTPDEYERLSKFPENKKISPYWLTKQESRIFLKVTDVRVERLQDITIDGIRTEGLPSMAVHAGDMEIALAEWRILWDSTIKKSDRDLYGWGANPWVWVIEFERISPDDCLEVRR